MRAKTYYFSVDYIALSGWISTLLRVRSYKFGGVYFHIFFLNLLSV
jgi:hypothetical protein